MNWDRPALGVPILVLLGTAMGLAYNGLMKEPLPWIATARPPVERLEDTPAPDAGHPEGEPAPAAAQESPPPVAGDTPPPADTKPQEPPAAGAKPIDHGGVPESEFPVMVSLQKAKDLYDRGLVHILDARDHEEYVEGHIPGAESAPFDEKAGDLEWLDAVAKEPKVVLVYCGGGDCELSLDLGFAVSQAGHRRVLVYEGGYAEWTATGYPVATGEAP